ncbi:MAG: mechanosensitive ion channel family protein [Gammaproteobacteria bacterium]|nr:mechanosensitive ion channel family protein [Gammaproteobacteria bacterium]MYD81284.1 mechanosensitive ion channel family protein [Gammaproteobacteria bacterium]
MLETFQNLISEHGTWMLQVFLIVTATVTAHQVARVAMRRLRRSIEDTETLWDDAIFDAASKPLTWAIWAVGMTWAGKVIYGATRAHPDAPTQIFAHVDTIREVLIIFLVAWFFTRLIGAFERVVSDEEQRDRYQRWDVATATAVGKVLRASVVITACLIMMQIFGLPVEGVLAFGGLGGIAVGFAAKDLLANFFGALMLFIDKPFTKGDWIRSPDQEIEGTVEEIGWRLTRIRTFDQRPLYVPNATFAQISVENPSRMRNRRIYETFGVRYGDLSSVKLIVDDVRQMLKNHPDIDLTRTLMVNVVSYGDFSVDFFVYTFTRTTVWTEFHEIKEDVLLKIGDIVQKHGADFAFPTQTLHLAEQIEADSQ